MAPPAAPADAIAAVLVKLEELGRKADHTNQRIEEMQASLHQLTEEQGAINSWKAELEGKVADLQSSVFLLEKKVDLVIHELPKPKIKRQREKSETEVPTPAHLGVPAKAEASGQFGHRDANSHQGVGAGVVTTLAPPPVTGATRSAPHTPVPFRRFELYGSPRSCAYNYPVRQIDFPKFDGTNPKI